MLAAMIGTAAFGIAIAVRTEKSFANDLAHKEHILRRSETGIVLLDRSNRPFFSFYDARKRTVIPLSQVPTHVRQAVIAVEDKDFASHRGFSVRAIVRSTLQNIRYGTWSYGGSTITQQLAKNTLLSARKSLFRKYQEIILARQLERRYSKNDILEMYLNSVYFGEGAFGIEAAARTYFHKPTKDLTLAEASMLAGLLPAPSRLSPISGDRKQAEARQKLVLQNMMEQRYISPADRERAARTPLTFAQPQESDQIG
ncbi:MAG: putative Peptidoglycan glycosyltransferase, partial [Parcubacteria group bacterium Gr01-1014_106]